MYKVTLLPDAERSLRKLTGAPLERVTAKIGWLQQKADLIIHHPLSSLPNDLKGLCRVRVGNYRIIYWIYTETKTIEVFAIEHRSRVYKSVQG